MSSPKCVCFSDTHATVRTNGPYNGPYTVPTRPLQSLQKHKEFIHSEHLSMWRCLARGARPEEPTFVSRFSLTPLNGPYTGPYNGPCVVSAQPLGSLQRHKEFIHSENLSMWRCLTWGARPEALIFVQVFALSTVSTMVPTTVPTRPLHSPIRSKQKPGKSSIPSTCACGDSSSGMPAPRHPSSSRLHTICYDMHGAV